MQDQTIAGIDQGIAGILERLEGNAREKANLESALASLQEARNRLLIPQGGAAVVNGQAKAPERVPAGDQSGKSLQASYPNRVAAILRAAGEPMAAAAISRLLTDPIAEPILAKQTRDVVHKVLGRRPDLFRKVVRDGKPLWELQDGAAETKPPAARPHKQGGSIGTAGSDLADKNIYESAAIILRDHGNQALHFRDIAAEAERRGYRSGRSARVPPQSFSVMMIRKSELFEKVGAGKFRLQESATKEG
jgi:hypothetical protein